MKFNARGVAIACMLTLCVGALAGCEEGASGRDASRLPTLSIAPPTRNSEAEAILRVLKADDEITPRDLSPEARTHLLVKFIVNEMKGLTLEGCPEDFRQSYQAHIGAWQQLLRAAVNRQDEVESVDELAELFALHGMEPRNDVERDFFAAMDEIKSTFEVCTGIAQRHGIQQSEYDLD